MNLFAKISALFRRDRRDTDMAAEMHAHLEEQTQRNLAAGMSPNDARAAAHRQFGGVAQIQERCREQRSVAWLEQLRQDGFYAVRGMRKNPGFTLVAALALTLGIGANSALFSVINGVLLRPLPLNEPERLAQLFEIHENNTNWQSVSAPNFADWRAQSQSFAHMALFTRRAGSVIGQDDAERVSFGVVSADFFEVLQTRPVLGRSFVADDDRPGERPVVVLSQGFWQRRFAGDPDIVGKSLNLDGGDLTIVGVMAPEARMPDHAQFWGTFNFNYRAAERRSQSYDVVARLKPGVSWAQAKAELQIIGRRLAAEYVDQNKGWNVAVVPLIDVVVGGARDALVMLLGAVGLVLLIACANVANLLMARGATREKEIAVRAALGANRGRLIRQLLTESLLLGALGGGLGLLFTAGAVKALPAWSTGIPRMDMIAVDARVLAFTGGVSLLAALFFGLVPALQISRPGLDLSLKSVGHGAGGPRRRLRSALVVAEVALAFVLLIGAGLMVRSFARLLAVDPGFKPDNVLSVRVSLPKVRYPRPTQQALFASEALREITTLSGVESAAATGVRVMSGGIWYAFTIDGRPPLPKGEFINAYTNPVSPDYFRTMGVPLRRGRWLTEEDLANTRPVAVISETMARKYWPNEDPIGQLVRLSDGQRNPREIVGIVGDLHLDRLENRTLWPAIYTPFAQNPFMQFTLVVRTSGDPAAVALDLRARLRTLEKNVSVDNATTLREVVDDSVAQWRFSTLLLVLLAGTALVLAIVGIYGVMSCLVAQSTHEIGVRMALGARVADVLKLIVGEGLRLALAGTVIGVGGALVLARLMQSFLWGDLSATDPTTIGAVAGALIGVVLLACLIPARRATKVDPMTALRAE